MHQTWLKPVRSRLAASGLTLDELVDRSGYSKTRLSELLRGKGYYPGWPITYSVVRVLNIPVGPLRRLWQIAALEADKDVTWIKNGIRDVPSTDRDDQPRAHAGLTQGMQDPYTAYAQAFLQAGPRAWQAVTETFDILWLTWDEATTSPDLRRYAWELLRTRVLARAARRPGGYPDLRAAAFCTTDPAETPALMEHLAQVDVFARFFDAIAHLPADQRDITVLRYLCGIDADAIPDIVGLPPAVTHTLDHHARWALKELFPDTDTELQE